MGFQTYTSAYLFDTLVTGLGGPASVAIRQYASPTVQGQYKWRRKVGGPPAVAFRLADSPLHGSEQGSISLELGLYLWGFKLTSPHIFLILY